MEWLNGSVMNAALSMAMAAACCLGAAVLMYRKMGGVSCKQKIREARDKREKGFRRAGQEVLRFREEHPKTDTTGILTLSLKELQEKLQQGSLSPEEVLFSYMEKTLTLQKKLNCCTEILLDSFDVVKTVAPSRNRPLYGVPVSIKDNIAYKGPPAEFKNYVFFVLCSTTVDSWIKDYDNTYGLVCYLDKPAKNNSVLVEVLKKQGAIPFVKTNVPQALLSLDCSNPIFGETVNPHNALKTPGGSSGGEAALIGGGGSLIGLGTDIGGSIRIPASFSGICALKPTSGRLSLQGIPPILPGQKSLKATVGPMARDVDSLARLMDALLCDDMFLLDPTVPPLPFNKQIYDSSSPLRIGYMITDGITQSTPSMARATREVKDLLENAGHVLVPYKPLNIHHFLYEIEKGFIADGATVFLDKLKEEPSHPVFSRQRFILSLPIWLKKTLAFLLKPVSSRISERIMGLCGVGSIPNLWKNQIFVEEYTHQTIAHWKKSKIDVLLCPSLGPAMQSRQSHKIPHCLSLSVVYNALNFPAGVVPVCTVTKEDEEELEQYKGHYGDVFDKCFMKAMSGGEGLPVAVQCVALPWQEELCLRFMREVESLVHQSRN